MISISSPNNNYIDMIDIRDIFINNPRYLWKDLILSFDHKINKDNNHIILENVINSISEKPDDLELSFTEEELDGKFPFYIGDIVTHINIGGKFIITDLPTLDISKDFGGDEFADYIISYPQYYDVIGYLNNGSLAGTELNPDYNGKDLSPEECYWKNWKKIGNIFMSILDNVDFEMFNKIIC